MLAMEAQTPPGIRHSTLSLTSIASVLAPTGFPGALAIWFRLSETDYNLNGSG